MRFIMNVGLIALFTFISGCAIPVENRSGNLIQVSPDYLSKMRCDEIGVVYGSESMGNSPNHDKKRAIQKAKNNAADIGGDTIVLQVVNHTMANTTVKAHVYNCTEIEVLESIPDILLTTKSVEIFGVAQGYGYEEAFIKGYREGLATANTKYKDLEDIKIKTKWRKEVSYLKGFIKSLSNNPTKLSKTLGKLSAIYEFTYCAQPNSKNKDCLYYENLSVNSLF